MTTEWGECGINSSMEMGTKDQSLGLEIRTVGELRD